MAAFASESGQPAAPRSACSRPTLANANARVRLAQRARSRPRARSRARSCPASTRRRPRSTRRSRGSRRRASWSSQDELGGLAEELAPATRRPGAADRRVDGAAAADRPRLAVRARRGPARPATSSIQDEFDDRRGELQGVLLRAGRARRRGPELRRQRHRTCASRPAAAPDGLARLRRARAPASSFGNNVAGAARQPAGVPGQAPAVQARASPVTSSDRTSTAAAQALRRRRRAAPQDARRCAPSCPFGPSGTPRVTAIRKHWLDFVAIIGC